MTRDADAERRASLRRSVPAPVLARAAGRRRRHAASRRSRTHHPKADLALIERAYAAAERAHAGQKRKSGEPYITHPVAVAQILADLGIGSKTIAAALLHDTVEDTDYTLDLLRADFGDEIAMLVDGVTKLDKLKYGDSAQAETVRKMVVAMSKDIRVLDHQARRPPAQRAHLGLRARGVRARARRQETLEIYAPLAHRLGIQAIKWELEDLSFAVLYPKLYVEIESLVRSRTPQREEFVQQVIDAVNDDLKADEDQRRGRRPAEAVLLDLPEDDRARSRVRRDLRPRRHPRARRQRPRLLRRARRRSTRAGTRSPGASRTTSRRRSSTSTSRCTRRCIGPKGRPVEIQIRTHEMHQRAEFGVAAHWKYKERMHGGRADGPRGQRHRDGVARAHLRLAGRDRRPGGVPRQPALRDRREGGLRLHAAGQGHRPARRRDARRLRLRGAHRGRPPHDGREGQRPARAARDARSTSGDVVEVFTSKNPDSGPSQDWLQLRQEPAGPQQDPAVVHQGAPRRGDRAGQGRHRPRHAQAEPAAAEADEPGRAHRGRGPDALRGRLGALRRGRRGPRLDPVGDREGARSRSQRHAGGGRGRVRVRRPRAAARHCAPATPACSCAAPPTSS